MIKLTYMIFPRPDLGREEASMLWLEEHGAMMQRHASTLRVARYVQTPHAAHPLEKAMAAARGVEHRMPLGMAEIYWNSQDDLEFSFSDPAARRAYRELLEDERRFAAPYLSPWLGFEREIISARAAS